MICRSDPCGIICIILTYVAVFYADYGVVLWMVVPTMTNSLLGMFNVLVFNIILFLLLMSHMRAVISDPGAVPLPENSLDFSDVHAGNKTLLEKEDWTVCSRCETYRPPRAHHCRICQRCIRRMDHHCPWINNCVGEFNQKYFIQFLLYVGLASIYTVAMVALSWTRECKDCNHEIIFKQHRVIHSVILVIESLLFGIFVIAIMCDQMKQPLNSFRRKAHIDLVSQRWHYSVKFVEEDLLYFGFFLARVLLETLKT
ncbi:DNZDHHC/NEW1 zinc finger protein 11 isoform X2 [Tachypleus tridentatus]|uniref:DNZDHHC/NEW1 zinc finger protein 11 isoform X2 n=1 Tax=Tachypleus tridentatus TaxID=6853 RepID=UPI003FD4FD6E